MTEIEYDSEAVKQGDQTWARLIQKVYEVNPLICPKLVLSEAEACKSDMKVVAVITDRQISAKCG